MRSRYPLGTSRAETFYRNVLGLEVGLRDETRKWLFLRAGGPAGMVVLQEKPDDGSPNTLLLPSQTQSWMKPQLSCRTMESY